MNGERFSVTYHIQGDEAEALAKARVIGFEQTVELPAELTPDGPIRDWIVGQVDHFAPGPDGGFTARISYAVETSAFELTQLLNVMFGNTSLQPGIRVTELNLGEQLLSRFPGPRFGIAGLRRQLSVSNGPLLCAALKPMGLSPQALAELAYQLALGGIDIVKDDHGLSDQPFAPFHERVAACAAAVARTNAETGRRTLYAPNITAPAPLIAERVRFARDHGAGALLMAPGLTGFDTMRALAQEETTVNLPLLSHPAWLGGWVAAPEHGIAHGVLFGVLQRLAGADASIYPNYGGRFAFSRAECAAIAEGCQTPLGHCLPIFPTPGGGMTLDRIPELLALYGQEVMFLMGGGLYGRSPDLAENARYFLSLVGR